MVWYIRGNHGIRVIMNEVESKVGIRLWMEVGLRSKSKEVSGALVLQGWGQTVSYKVDKGLVHLRYDFSLTPEL